MRGASEPRELFEDSVEAYFTAAPRGGVYAAALLALALAGATLPLVRVDVTEHATGVIRPSIEQHRIAAPLSGAVASVPARLGQRVAAGDVLLRLRGDASDARLAAADSAELELRRSATDLEGLVAAAGALSRADAPAPPHAAATPALPRFLLQRLRMEREWTELRREVAPARAERDRVRALVLRGLAPPADLERAGLALARAEAAPRLLAAREQASFAAELSEVRARLVALAAERAELVARARASEVRAPRTGTLESLGAVSPGSWVTAGEEIAVLSPDAPLVAELYVEPRRIGFVRRGMPVRLRVDALDHHEWGTLPAIVSDVARDVVPVAGRPVFRVRCVPTRDRLRRPGGGTARPGKGMAVVATFPLGRRTLAQLLWRRAAAALDPRGD